MHGVISDKRERILAAASDLIVKNGLQCPMAEIAQAAGVATGTLYNYFASKDDLVRGVYGRMIEQIVARLIVEHAPTVPYEARIRRYIDDYIDFIWVDPGRAILFEYLANVPLLPPQEMQALFSRLSTWTERLFAEAQAAGVLRDGNHREIATFVGGGIRNALKWRRVAGSSLTKARRRELAALCWAAIAA